MPHIHVSAAGGALPAGRHFIEVTPSLRRALELLMDGLVLVMDELDGDIDCEGNPGPGGWPIDPDLDLDVVDHPHDEDDEDPLEHTANETFGGGYFYIAGQLGDDMEIEEDKCVTDDPHDEEIGR